MKTEQTIEQLKVDERIIDGYIKIGNRVINLSETLAIDIKKDSIDIYSRASELTTLKEENKK